MIRWRWVFLAVLAAFSVGLGIGLTRHPRPDGVIVVWTTYPGADPEAMYRDVARPIEEQLERLPGVRRTVILTPSGGLYLLVMTFPAGTDLDVAKVQVADRVMAVEPRLPEVVRAGGVSVAKSSDTTAKWKHGYLDGR